MSEPTSPEVISLTKHEGRRDSQPVNAGRRKLTKDGLNTNKDGAREKTFGELRYLEQDVDSVYPLSYGTSSRRWKDYLQDGIRATGVMTADRTLIWFPSVVHKDGISNDEAIRIAAQLKPNLQAIATFRFGENPELTTHKGSVSIKALSPEYNNFSQDVADYFVRSLGESEEHSIVLYNAGESNPAFTGSTHEYFRFFRKA